MKAATIAFRATTASSGPRFTPDFRASHGTGVHTAEQCRHPLAVSRAQACYWSRAWQEAEREALRELRTGQGRRFASADEAVAYLLADGD